MSEFTKPVEKLSESTKDYVKIKTDELKLQLVKGLSISVNQILSLLLVLFCGLIVLLAIAITVMLLMGSLIGNYAMGALLVAIIFAALTYYLYRKKDTMFVDTFVELFAKLFFEEDEEPSDGTPRDNNS